MNRLFAPLLLSFAASLLLLAPLAATAAESNYPRGELLVEPAELAKSAKAKGWVILDGRGEEAYGAGHIPAARRIDHGEWKNAFDSDAVDRWSRRIGELGIDAESTVVVYDDNQLKDAARIWWILGYWGVADVRLLNGGWKAWQAADLPITQDAPSEAPQVSFQARPQQERLTTKEEILRRLPANGLQIVDTRSEAEFCGTDPRSNARAGAIPGAMHLEWKELIDQDSGRLKSAAEIERLFQQTGIDVNEPVVTHCQSGGRASVMAFGLELMGGRRVGNYYPGWSEWGNLEHTPVDTPVEK